MLELVLVRHGETDSNRTHTIQGHLDTPLSDVGEEQARRVGAFLANQTFHAALSSDLKRAVSTGEAIKTCNSSIDQLVLEPVLRERSFGDLEGKPFEAMMEAIKGLNKEEKHTWGPPNGETGVMFRERIDKFLKVLHSRAVSLEVERPVILVATHGGFIRELNFLLVEKYNCEMPCGPDKYGRISPNTGVSRFQLAFSPDGHLEKAQCTQLYCKDHLEGIETLKPLLYGI
eukprot:TRINITY_DN15971_c0_g1_i5.p1 TRINITY_DN15971_c0_g1~~TRINITY_DN15971_c0_g1_i5.p1  ORF type:complete len:230 (+),score=50.79 TRINITY_DN15971_c0_g1_i5:31-720(+)